MKLTGAGFLLLFVLINSTTAHACTLADAQNNFSQFNRVFLSYNRAIIAQKDRPPAIVTQSDAQATSQTDTNTEALNMPKIDELVTLLEKRANIIKQTAVIRKLFAEEVQQKPDMKTADDLNPVICEKFAVLAKDHNIIIHISPVQEKPLVCTKQDLNPRFIAATRRQRKLTLAGKVNGKERVSYLKMLQEFKNHAKSNFDLACRPLHKYEKRLKAEKGDE